jgi:hypothetical protein
MRRSRNQHTQQLDRVRGEIVEPGVPVARPVPRRPGSGGELAGSLERRVVVHHVYDAPPPAPAPLRPGRRVPVWAIVVAYFAMAIGIVLLVLALSSGPIIQPPHTPTKVHHHGRTTR